MRVSIRNSPRQSVVVAALLSVYVVAALTSARQKSITFDELAHLTAGFSSWTTADYRLFPENGQFPKRWAALPLVVSGMRFPSVSQPAWWTSDVDTLGYQFLYGVGNDHEALLWRARMAMVALAVVLGWVCYSWARRLFGVAGGNVALLTFILSPSVLAHGPLATSDLASALMFISALGCFWTTLHRAGRLRLAGSALVMGLLFVTKMSAFLMVPVAIALTLIRIAGGRPFIWSGREQHLIEDRRRLVARCGWILAAHALGILLVIWTFYGFRYSAFRDAIPERDRMQFGETIDTLVESNITRAAIIPARNLHLLPESYLFGLAHVFNRSGRFLAFLNGRYSVDGWWYFFPYCWLVKTPLPTLALLVLSAGALWHRIVRSTATRRRLSRISYRLAPLLVFFVAYWTAAIATSLNLGERHLLPAYPALFVLIGAAGWWFSKSRVAATLVTLAVLWLSVDSMRIWPDYLAYFNSLAGGPRSGYQHLVDSSLDWGQDLVGLKRWLDRNAPMEIPLGTESRYSRSTATTIGGAAAHSTISAVARTASARPCCKACTHRHEDRGRRHTNRDTKRSGSRFNMRSPPCAIAAPRASQIPRTSGGIAC